MKFETREQYDKAELDVTCPHCDMIFGVEVEIGVETSGSVEVSKVIK